jgi:hypothetical protein
LIMAGSSLSAEHRKLLARAVLNARRESEAGARESLRALAVDHHEPFGNMNADARKLRNALRAHGRQLGDALDPKRGTQAIDRLTHEVAFEHWHRMLFARFLAENGLLMHPSLGAAVTLQECQELAREERKDPWGLAATFAQVSLPQIFRQDDPALRISLPANARAALERIVGELPAELFHASDSLGWVYQFWQTDKKDEVNASGKKIGADEISPVTQLFTEDYMVDFLLDNTLGAWWAGKQLAANPHLATAAASEVELRKAVALPGCPWNYLRFLKPDEGAWRPAAGTFDGWPKSAAALRALDPCMGSGHFVVAMFERLVALRLAEEKLDEAAAVAAVIRDNLFGLEIDSRCTQIAAFNLALAAWRRVGHCSLPSMNLACSGLAPNTREADWLAIAGHNQKLRNGMERLYRLFENAPVLGSLINPRAGEGDLLVAAFPELQPLLEKALAEETKDDTAHEMAVTARGLAKAAEILAGQFTLVATNVPYLGRGKQDQMLQDYCERVHLEAKADLATCFVERCLGFCAANGSTSLVTPQNWLFLSSYQDFRTNILCSETWNLVARLGPNGFSSIGGEVVQAALPIITRTPPARPIRCLGIDAASAPGERAIPPQEKAILLRGECETDPLPGRDGVLREIDIEAMLKSPGAAFSFAQTSDSAFLCESARSFVGLQTGDSPKWIQRFWEQSVLQKKEWWPFQLAPEETRLVEGCVAIVRWGRSSELAESPGARVQGVEAWGKRGVLIQRMSSLKATLYHGQPFDTNTAAIVPIDKELTVAALFAFCASTAYAIVVRDRAPGLSITNQALVNIPFPKNAFSKVASTESLTLDPSQWLFNGHPAGADQPLHVAVARLLGYQWPRQTGSSFPDCPALGPDGLEKHADDDGIVPINPMRGEPAASERLISLLRDAYTSTGQRFDLAVASKLLAETGGKATEFGDWLLNEFFEQHCKLFHNRPFLLHIWDGRKDGFNVLVNYHRLAAPGGAGRQLLEKLTYDYLKDWIDRQNAGVKNGDAGAEARLAAATKLQKELIKIIEGEAPYDIFVRWKPLAEQAIGWSPDINDGVRMNIRPFMLAEDMGKKGAGLLRTKPNIKWDKDRGKEPERPKAHFPWFWSCDPDSNPSHATDFTGGREFTGGRWNDLHYTLAVKTTAKAAARGSSTSAGTSRSAVRR